MGIPADKRKAIFGRFQQFADLTHYTSGVGLGLSIVKGLIETMGGSIKADSVTGEGSIFTFNLPSVYDHKSKSSNENPIDDVITMGNVKRILLVDGTVLIHLCVDSLLADYDVEVVHAYDGDQAVQIFREQEGIDLILMDLKMSKLNGEETFYEIRKLDTEVPIVAQSAFAMNNEIRYKSIGFTEYVAKPIS